MTRRSIIAAISILVHAVVVFFAMTADLWRPITEWPTPRSALAFVDDVVRPVHLEDIELPKPQRMPTASSAPITGAPQTSTTPIELAPVQPPSGIGNETGNERRVVGTGQFVDIESGGVGFGGIGPAVAPAPPPQPTQPPIRLHSGIQAPRRVANVTPVYPAAARVAHVEGFVIIEATIDERGNVARAQVVKSRPLLDEAALAAVRQWKFTPTMLNGVAVPIVMTVTVNFKLD
ncbi:MAG TPA: energy transducer TonB [Vicinamibacterales bacterium]|nr:energy transducer TonB [Vicinamibacterales bacterium]